MTTTTTTTTTSNETSKTTSHFPQGSEVEVSSDEEGFTGAWFRATVVASSAADSMAAAKRRKVPVQYRNLVTEDGAEQLREHVDLVHVRPLPPAVGCLSFEVGDIVDADYRDGWWTGVVKKALGSSKFRVFFDNPPDMIEFHQNQLRVHQDWINGIWIRPKREPQMTGSHFSPGTDVEVNLGEEDSIDVWIPAIVVKENKDNTFLVKYHHPKPKQWGHTVDFLHIRPPAPRYADKLYKLHERVEVFHDSAWWPGDISKILSAKAYLVNLKNGIKSKEVSRTDLRPRIEWKGGKWEVKSKDFPATSNSKVKEDSEPPLKKIKTTESSAQLESQGAIEDKLEKRTPHPANSGKNLTEQSAGRKPEPIPSVPVSNSNTIETTPAAPINGVERGRRRRKLKDKDLTVSQLFNSAALERLPARTRKPVSPFKFENYMTSKRKNNGAVEAQKAAPAKQMGRPKKDVAETPEAPARGKVQNARTGATKKSVGRKKAKSAAEFSDRVTSSTEGTKSAPVKVSSRFLNKELETLTVEPKRNSNEPEEDKILEHSQPEAGINRSNRRKRGRPRKLVVLGLEASDEVDPSNEAGHVQEIVQNAGSENEVSQPVQQEIDEATDSTLEVYRRKRADVSPTKGITNETGKVSVKQGNSVNDDDDDQPLSTLIVAKQSKPPGSESESLDKQNGHKEQAADTAKEAHSINASDEDLPQEIQELPFTKTSLIWKVIESMEIFRRIPQSPHFRPLYECNEDRREGQAIGFIVTFSSMADRISKLQFEDSTSVFSSTLETLLDLENQGFNVTALRDRVNELLSIKNKLEPIHREAKDMVTEMTERKDEVTNLVKEIEEVERKMSELKEKGEYIRVQLEVKDLEVKRLEQYLDATNASIFDLQRDFTKLRAVPFD